MTGPQHTIAMPASIAKLIRNKAGYPIPWFVAGRHVPNPDFRVAGRPQFRAAVLARCCWACGRPRPGGADTFVLGPMCAVNRVSAEPPAHPECASYSVQVCPFLSRPEMQRRDAPVPEPARGSMAGVPLLRNPGVALLWTCAEWQITKIDNGWIFDLGEPLEVSWWAQGRPATRVEALAALESGMPALRKLCESDEDLAELEDAYQEAVLLLPAAARCPERTDHPLAPAVRCELDDHGPGQHQALVNGTRWAWTHDEHHCVRYRTQAHAAGR